MRPVVLSWPTRFDDLRRYLYDPADDEPLEARRKFLASAWERACNRNASPEPEVREWRVTIGRALLDFPDLDREAIKRVLQTLQPVEPPQV